CKEEHEVLTARVPTLALERRITVLVRPASGAEWQTLHGERPDRLEDISPTTAASHRKSQCPCHPHPLKLLLFIRLLRKLPAVLLIHADQDFGATLAGCEHPVADRAGETRSARM